MTIQFKYLATITACGCFLLTLVWLFSPSLLLTVWGIDYTSGVTVVSRRVSAVFLGLGIIFWMIRDEPPSKSRSAVGLGFSAMCIALGALGIFELSRGTVGIGILSAVALELGLAIAFMLSMHTASTLDR
jgi:hypothetical protein